MKTVRLGTTGLEVSRLTLGCMTYGDPDWRSWILDEGAARAHFRKALDLGINFFDTANMYSRGVSEEITGKLLRELAHREDYVLASKVYFPVAKGPNRGGLSRKHILAACDASLKRLGLDYIDLYQIHRFDHETPVEETIEALDSLVKAGEGPLSRREQHGGVGVRHHAFDRGRHGCHALRLDAEPHESRLSRRRTPRWFRSASTRGSD